MNPTHAKPSHLDWVGIGLVTLSAVGFATLAIFGKFAFNAGMVLPTMLALRFGGATILFWLWLTTAMIRRPATRHELNPTNLSRRKVISLLLMGGIGYAVQSASYLGAVTLIPVALVGMLLYTYPAWVTLLAWWVDGERPDTRHWLALALALAGTTLIAGSPDGGIQPLGVALAMFGGIWYSGYIVLGNRVVKGVPPLVSSAWVAVGGAISFIVAGLALGQLRFDFVSPDGWLAIGGMVLFATVIPIIGFIAGLQRVGPSRAAILSTLEPVFTLILAISLLGERLSPLQFVGSALVLLAVVLLQLRR